jgi:hypothetical protein
MKANTIIAMLLLLALGAGEAAAMSRGRVKASSRKKHRRVRVVWNPLLRGSYDSMLRQNEEIDRLLLPRIQNDDELQEMILRQELLELTDSDGIALAPNLDVTRRYARPWTRDFVNDLGDAFYAEFGRPIQITSAVRTVEQQKKLRRRNRNAAPIEGEVASSHLAGTTVDIGKRGLSRKEKKWLEQYLKGLQDNGLIEAAEERRQACFHVMVLQKYSDSRTVVVEDNASESD